MNLSHSREFKDGGNPNKTQENMFPNLWTSIYLCWSTDLTVNVNSVLNLLELPHSWLKKSP